MVTTPDGDPVEIRTVQGHVFRAQGGWIDRPKPVLVPPHTQFVLTPTGPVTIEQVRPAPSGLHLPDPARRALLAVSTIGLTAGIISTAFDIPYLFAAIGVIISALSFGMVDRLFRIGEL